MRKSIVFRSLLPLLLFVSTFTVALPMPAAAQTAPVAVQTDLAARVAKIEEEVERRRQELGIPGMALVIIADGKIVSMKGYGYKDLEKKIPATADTQFAIGSASKAFTALSVLMTQDEGKLSLEDSPRKYLPYFHLMDPDANEKIVIRDILSHSSGINRTDLAMLTNKLTREELIRVLGDAKPVSKLREKFNYQNIMFAAAGEIVAKTQKTPWESFVPVRIFAPLGMTNSTVTIQQELKAKDYSFGYDYNMETKLNRRLPFRNIGPVAPAGSINSSVRDMAKWVTFVMDGGTVNGKRLVSENGYTEWVKPQMTIAGKTSYGFGWILQDWNGLKVVQHGGNIDGFSSQVAMIPEKKLGFVMLTNLNATPLGSELMPIIWKGILEQPQSVSSEISPVEKEVGKYKFPAPEFDIDISLGNGKLVMTVPGQPKYILENVGGRRYKMTGAPEGFFVTFKDDSMFLEQPQGNYTLQKRKGEPASAPTDSGAARELIGKYQTPEGRGGIEIKTVDGKVSLVVGPQAPLELREQSKDSYRMGSLPETYLVKANRRADGTIEGITIVQPEGQFKFVIQKDVAPMPTMSADEIMAKMIEAVGGEAALRKITSQVMTFNVDFENQGVKGYGTIYAKAPFLYATDTTLTALGKPIGTTFEFVNAASAGQTTSFSPGEIYTGKKLIEVQREHNIYAMVDWKAGLKSYSVKGIDKVGAEEAWVLEFAPENGTPYSLYISVKSNLPIKRTGVVTSSTSTVQLPVSTVMSDYRSVNGVMIPFKLASATVTMGDVVMYVKEVKHNVSIADTVFQQKK